MFDFHGDGYNVYIETMSMFLISMALCKHRELGTDIRIYHIILYNLEGALSSGYLEALTM